jgi:hypothetical protein
MEIDCTNAHTRKHQQKRKKQEVPTNDGTNVEHVIIGDELLLHQIIVLQHVVSVGAAADGDTIPSTLN